MNGVTSMMMMMMMVGIVVTTLLASQCESFCCSSVVVRRKKTFSLVEARRRNNRYYDDDDDDDDYDDNNYDDEDENYDRRRSRRGRIDNLGREEEGKEGLDLPSPFGRRSGMRLPESVSKALLAGVFVLGIGTGVTVDSQINTNPRDLASRDAVDQAAPNPRLCTTMGASAMAFDQRVFVSFNPFNVYVAQADVKPACVLRPSNVVSVLQDRSLVNDKEVRACKQNMNTWAFVGDLDNLPQLSCVYKSEDAQNEFLSNPKYGIGEDVYDDDRATILDASSRKKQTKKLVKDDLTQAQKDKINRAKAEALKKDSVFNSPSEILEKDQIDI
eukprot:CAMPEP_0197824006 /NCGR_PEP_ID=MMETSP1437-20131217/1324_1 /TAXON_ID=49252 ORGANISM="Eucampia antarctica, Strain CCMP1452" /NCGR_SAMPLE_ID=MMETSP1437 /ASSEMBLY_ACC=CAM_ASM_001096 /LENGTH=328 /DNA_ID=CAMNT_0043423467 /DNA_START=33 /DNA_END=1019 /DNA_ORIENTATION=+